jgi:4-diphosphocytidyl-2-C-methyl-D-erythritol kinase
LIKTQAPSAPSLEGYECVGGLVELARAKVNLTLEIKGKRADGYHELESLVLFADFGDIVEYRPGGAFSLRVTGPFSGALQGDNLLERAARFYAELSGSEPDGAYHLVKHIPVAAGLGGGSADAAAALRILATRGKQVEPSLFLEAARRVGADVPCCLSASAAVMTGIGDNVHLLEPLTPVPAVLVNPMMPLSTSAVFRELSAEPLAAAPAQPLIPKFAGAADLAAYAKARANDLETPARRLLPIIGDILAALDAAPGALLSRLSGSGPTCFALFADAAHAAAAVDVISCEHPGWWVRAISLG